MSDDDTDKTEPQQVQQPAINPMMILQQHCSSIISNSVLGLISSLPQFPGGAPVLVACSRALGMLIGSMYRGDLQAVLILRKQCKDAFWDAISHQAPQPMPQSPPPPMTVDLHRGRPQ